MSCWLIMCPDKKRKKRSRWDPEQDEDFPPAVGPPLDNPGMMPGGFQVPGVALNPQLGAPLATVLPSQQFGGGGNWLRSFFRSYF